MQYSKGVKQKTLASLADLSVGILDLFAIVLVVIDLLSIALLDEHKNLIWLQTVFDCQGKNQCCLLGLLLFIKINYPLGSELTFIRQKFAVIKRNRLHGW